MSTVYVVFCMDTEGPVVDPRKPDLLDTWDRVDAAMDKLFADGFRARIPDSAGGGFKIGWFFLTWTGFRTNPAGRDLGYHKVRDHYLARWGTRLAATGDEQCWHYHHPAPSGIGNEWGLDWNDGSEYAQIMSRQLLERRWFPTCYRAGGTIMSPASSRWVDTWFPFDYSNRAPLALAGLVDWSHGVAEWNVYHPGVERFDRPGSARRRMARCLDLDTSVYRISDDDISSAFARAASGHPAILSCFDHDYRDIEERVNAFRARVTAIAAQYPSIPWRYAGPEEAIRAALGVGRRAELRLECMRAGDDVRVWSSAPIYQSIPWLAVRMVDGSVQHVEEDLLRCSDTEWRWSQPPGFAWSEAVFGASTELGAAATVQIGPLEGGPKGFLDVVTGEHTVHPRSIWEHSKLYTELCTRRAGGAEAEMDSVAQARDILASRLTPGASLLDAGCGAGHAFLTLRGLGIEYHGVDSHVRAIEIGRTLLSAEGLPPERLRSKAIEDLPRGERFDAVLCLNTLSYQPMFHLPLEALARAAREWLVIRSSFGERTEIRYLPDPWLEPGFEDTRAYFNVFSRTEVGQFLEQEGFEVTWVADRRQSERFGGAPEVVAGIPIPAEFLVARRVRPAPLAESTLGPAGVAEVFKFRSTR